jgi:hypothetical protein
MEWQIRQPERQDGLLGTGEHASQTQSAQKQTEYGAEWKQAVRHHACAAQVRESQHPNKQPARNHKQHIMDDQQVFHRRCLRCRQTSCSTISVVDERYPRTGSVR